MQASISWLSLTWCLLPLLLVGCIYFRWLGQVSEVVIASGRMVLQLVAIGYLLLFIFESPSVWIFMTVLLVMLLAATWIALRPLTNKKQYFFPISVSLFVAVAVHLIISIELVLLDGSWLQPRITISLAGMYFANSMNAISLALERFQSELAHGKSVAAAKHKAFEACMIPQINGLLAVGIVALPGMMTGQIVSGVSPLVAVKYQILIMAMLLGAAGIAASMVLWGVAKRLEK